MNKPRICAVITHNNPHAISSIEPLVDLFEVRIDLIGNGWQEVVQHIKKPWIACNRRGDEGGNCQGSESQRVTDLLKSLELGADIIDIELRTDTLKETVPQIKERAECLISFHDIKGTPSPAKMKGIVRSQLEAGADICKIVTTAHTFEDNISTLQLIADFPDIRLVAFAMGQIGVISRIFCPLAGGDFTYASIEEGRASAPGQITVSNLNSIYGVLKHDE